jgi:hypothetical protein
MGYLISRGHHGRDRMVDGFTTTYAISRSVVFSKSSTNKTDHHDITEILLKVALNTIKQTNKQTKKHYFYYFVLKINILQEIFPSTTMSKVMMQHKYFCILYYNKRSCVFSTLRISMKVQK